MKTSDQINEIATALSKAQGAIDGAIKGKENPHFRSKYADLGAVWDACREHLSANGIAVVQPVARFPEGGLGTVTRLTHSSGQWMEDDGMPLLLGKQDMQGLGSALTYSRRYGLMAMVGVAPEDDDGNAASAKAAPKVAATAAPAKPAGFDAWMLNLADAADDGLGSLEAAWKAAKPEHRSYLTATDNTRWLAMKAHAAKPQAVGA